METPQLLRHATMTDCAFNTINTFLRSRRTVLPRFLPACFHRFCTSASKMPPSKSGIIGQCIHYGRATFCAQSVVCKQSVTTASTIARSVRIGLLRDITSLLTTARQASWRAKTHASKHSVRSNFHKSMFGGAACTWCQTEPVFHASELKRRERSLSWHCVTHVVFCT